jgi:hypothetical protein
MRTLTAKAQRTAEGRKEGGFYRRDAEDAERFKYGK